MECALLLNAGVQLKARDREENMEEQYAALATLRWDKVEEEKKQFSGASLPRREKGELQCLCEVRWPVGSWSSGRRAAQPAPSWRRCSCQG